MTAHVDHEAFHAFLERAAPDNGIGTVTVRIYACLCEVRIQYPAAPTLQVVGLLPADAVQEETVLTAEWTRFHAAVRNSHGSVSINMPERLVAGRQLPEVSPIPFIDRPSGTPFTAEICSPVTLTSAGVIAVATSVIDAFKEHQVTTVAAIANRNDVYLSGAADPGLVLVAAGRMI